MTSHLDTGNQDIPNSGSVKNYGKTREKIEEELVRLVEKRITSLFSGERKNFSGAELALFQLID